MSDLDFEALIEIARGAIDKASHNFGADDLESERALAFAWVCLSQAARRYIANGNTEAVEHLEIFLSYWEFVGRGEERTPPRFELIKGGKD